MSEVGGWSQAGGACHTSRAGFWWAALPETEWPGGPEEHAEMRSDFQEPFGDRRQELVLIGMGMNEAALRAEFDRCLLTDDEMRAGPAHWSTFADPFLSWGEVLSDDDGEEENEEPHAA